MFEDLYRHSIRMTGAKSQAISVIKENALKELFLKHGGEESNFTMEVALKFLLNIPNADVHDQAMFFYRERYIGEALFSVLSYIGDKQ